jgi:hypothetical protein
MVARQLDTADPSNFGVLVRVESRNDLYGRVDWDEISGVIPFNLVRTHTGYCPGSAALPRVTA